MTCAFHYYTPWRVARPPIVSKGWQMEGRYCDICGQRFSRRHSRTLAAGGTAHE